MRADGCNRLPMVRMTNVGLLPGDSSLDEIIAATDDGIFMDTNRSWSIDDRRLNFQFGCEIGYEIKNGKRGRMLSNPTYTGISPQFWASMDRLGGRDDRGPGHAQLRQGAAAPGRPHRPSGGAGPVPGRPGGGDADEHDQRARPCHAGRRASCDDGAVGRGHRARRPARADPVRQLVHPPERRRGHRDRLAQAVVRRPHGERHDDLDPAASPADLDDTLRSLVDRTARRPGCVRSTPTGRA